MGAIAGQIGALAGSIVGFQSEGKGFLFARKIIAVLMGTIVFFLGTNILGTAAIALSIGTIPLQEEPFAFGIEIRMFLLGMGQDQTRSLLNFLGFVLLRWGFAHDWKSRSNRGKPVETG